jgi:hypothetical protein
MLLLPDKRLDIRLLIAGLNDARLMVLISEVMGWESQRERDH